MNSPNESARIILDNLRAYIEMYREWGAEGVRVKWHDKTPVEAYGRTPLLQNIVHQTVEEPASKASERGRLQKEGTDLKSVPNREGATRVPTIKSSALAALRDEIGDCTRCKLHAGRTQIVFGTGHPEAELMFVGEAPGEDEDRQGRPFVGKAGQLLTRIIEAMGFKREEVYIANIIKCRPSGNRNPEPDEIASCSPFIQRQIEILRPKVICALGTFAAQTLLGTGQKISQLRGRFHDLPIQWADHAVVPIKVMPTFHPAYLLRNPQDKKQVWEDMQQIMREIAR